MKKRFLTHVISTLAISLLVPATASTPSPQQNSIKIKVSVLNVTAANAISPFLTVVLKKGTKLFQITKTASLGVATLAETGNTSPLEAELAQNPALIDIKKAEGGPLLATQSKSIELEINKRDIQKGATLNLIAMIGKSNDSFISVSALPLTALLHQRTLSLDAINYDAGSEENSGNLSDFGPGGHPTDNAEGHISIDRGLNQRGDAPEIINWGSVAAKVFIERVQ